jgi:hypothetical protein
MAKWLLEEKKKSEERILYFDSFHLGITGKNKITDVATKTATSIMVTKNINLLDLISFNTKNLPKITQHPC